MFERRNIFYLIFKSQIIQDIGLKFLLLQQKPPKQALNIVMLILFLNTFLKNPKFYNGVLETLTGPPFHHQIFSGMASWYSFHHDEISVKRKEFS